MNSFKSVTTVLTLSVLIACSSDPCEVANCVNGICIDGTCQCDEGFVGAQCDELPCVNGTTVNGKCECDVGYYGLLCDVNDLSGFYELTTLQYTNCPNYVVQYDLSGTTDDVELCGVNASDRNICFNFNYVFFDPEELRLIEYKEIMVQSDNGEWRPTFQFQQGGNYTLNNEIMNVQLLGGESYTLTIDGDQLIRTSKFTDGGDSRCMLLEVYTKKPD